VFCGFLQVKVTSLVLAGSVLNAGGDSRAYLVHSLAEAVRLAAGYRRLMSRRWARNLSC
jgi:hypothetical protein